MQNLMSRMRAAMEKYNMIEEGDVIAVGVSGGKDSLALLYALAEMRRFYPVKYDVKAITADMRFFGEKTDFSEITALCENLGIEHIIRETELYHIIFETRKEKNPCSLCAKMRKGALYTAAKELGCNKAAFAHHADDAIETLLLSLFFEGKMRTFLPVTYLSRMDITLIRPLIYLPEQDVINAVAKNDIPIAKSPCPANGNTKREVIKNLVKDLRKINPDIKKSLFAAIKNKDNYLLWDKSGQNNE